MVVKSIYKNEYKVYHSPMERLYNVDKFIGKKQIKVLSLFRGEIEKTKTPALVFHRGNCHEDV